MWRQSVHKRAPQFVVAMIDARLQNCVVPCILHVIGYVMLFACHTEKEYPQDVAMGKSMIASIGASTCHFRSLLHMENLDEIQDYLHTNMKQYILLKELWANYKTTVKRQMLSFMWNLWLTQPCFSVWLLNKLCHKIHQMFHACTFYA